MQNVCWHAGQYIRIANGSTDAQPLAGWKLRSQCNGSEFVFPNLTLGPSMCLVFRRFPFCQKVSNAYYPNTEETLTVRTAPVPETVPENQPTVYSTHLVWDQKGRLLSSFLCKCRRRRVFAADAQWRHKGHGQGGHGNRYRRGETARADPEEQTHKATFATRSDRTKERPRGIQADVRNHRVEQRLV